MKTLIVLFSIFYLTLSANTFVSLTFDDGWDNHHDVSLLLDTFGYSGTFYINSDRIGKSYRLTLEQLHDIHNRNHEVGGHTKTHANLRNLSEEEQRNEICGDREQLLSWGFNVTSFCYPYGADTTEAFKILTECGYNSARDSGGVKTNSSCTRCPGGESVPPGNPYQMRSISYKKVMGVDGLKWYVTQAKQYEQTTGEDSWIIFVFHEYGNFPDKSQDITHEEMTNFLTWLGAQNVNVRRVDTLVNAQQQPIFTSIQPHPSPNILVALTFDDGTSDHMNVASVLDSLNMNGTFFINTEHIGNEGFMTTTDLTNLQNNGHEIGSHTVSGLSIVNLPTPRKTQEICTCKEDLETLGLTVHSISWPYGEINDDLISIAQGCGHQLGRDIGGLRVPEGCYACPSSVELPTNKPFQIRSFNVKSFHSFGNLVWQILRAEENAYTSPSIAVFSFHTVCDRCAYSPERFEQFATWLKAREAIGTKVVRLRDMLDY